ncbi:MAG: hypothetical protein KJO54_05705 [Gammaproteobacteria bacterium]|nr:hypothetical protein [Gammaproteobacteria bacterium]
MQPEPGMIRLVILLLLSFSLAANGAQVCTTTTLVDKDLNGISGSSDSNIIAVGKDGNIARWDGSVWTSMSSPTTEDLSDVEVVDANTAFAVGKKGTVLQLTGGVWVEQSTPTDKELQGVWAASANEAWAVGKNGTIIYWDGSSWTDVSTAAQAGGREMVDAWGNSTSLYSLDKEGVLYRYDRITDSWDLPDNTCDVGGGNFEDLWGDGSGDIYLVKKDEVYLYDGATCSIVATASKDLLGIYGVSGTGQVVAVGKDARVLEYDGSSWTETDEGVDDFRDVWVSRNGNAYYAGKKGELTACQCVSCIVPGFVITHDSFGIHCLDETVRIDVIDTISGNPYTDYAGQLIIDTGSGSGSWSLLTGGGTFSDPVAEGMASYTWPAGESSAEFSLSYREGTPVIDVEAYDSVDPGTRDDDSEGTLTFSASGFSVTAAPLSNPPPAVVTPFGGPVTAGTNFPLYLTAYGQTPNDPQCGVIESYAGVQNLKFWSAYVDPGTGTVPVTINGGAIATAEAGAAAQAVTFTNGQASVTAKYKDAGRIQVLLKDDTLAHPDLPNGIRGATANFVSRPDRFVLSNITDASLNANPGAATAAGPVFVAAGDPFRVTVTALDAEGDATPNYGRENVPESVLLSPVLVLPVAGSNPVISAPTGFGAFSGGSATGIDFGWPEVGIIQLTPSVFDGNYLGTGDVTGTTSGNVGRFIPHHFAVALNMPSFGTLCDAGGFTYLGQPFDYLVAPQVTVTAEAAGNTTTQNYTGAFWKLDNASLVNRTYTAATGTLDTSGLPAAASDPVIVDSGGGVGTLTFSSGAGLAFQRTAPAAPFDADIELNIDVLDSDSVAATANPVTFGNPGGIAFDAGRSMRHGRIVVESALGSERVDLAVPMRVQYYFNAASGFVTHAGDSCANNVSLTLSAFAGNLIAGETCVMDTGTPGNSGAGCAVPALAGKQFREPPLAGDFNLYLGAPGAGNDGSATVTATVPAWLRYDWDSALPGDENPAGRVTFGIFRGNDQTIYQREVY